MDTFKNYGSVVRLHKDGHNDSGTSQTPQVLSVCKESLYFYLYMLVYLAFLMSGAAVFCILEAPEETKVRVKVENSIQRFLHANPNVTAEDLRILLKDVTDASNHGIVITNSSSNGERNWNFAESIFFASTVVTTIGYGHVTPLSSTGKIFCIFYATVGIPLTLVLLSALVERLLVPVVRLLSWMHMHLEHIWKPLNIRLLHLIIMLSIMFLGFITIPAAIFTIVEPEWNFLDSFYYCFITLTTIGLGDYIPGESENQPFRSFYKTAVTVYLFAGITFMMLTLAVFYDIPQLNLGLLFTKNEYKDTENTVLIPRHSGVQYDNRKLSRIENNYWHTRSQHSRDNRIDIPKDVSYK